MRADAIRAGERRLFVNYPRGITGFASSIRESCRAVRFPRISSLESGSFPINFPPSGDRISEIIFLAPFLPTAWLNLNAVFFLHEYLRNPANHTRKLSRRLFTRPRVYFHCRGPLLCLSPSETQFLSPSLLTGIDECIYCALAPINRSINRSRCPGETNNHPFSSIDSTLGL